MMEGTLTILPRRGVKDDGTAEAAYKASQAAEEYGLPGEARYWAIKCGWRAAQEGRPQP